MENKITRIIFKNNGFAFRLEDWNRLKKIAEGNPDEQKVNYLINHNFIKLNTNLSSINL
jgi:hypothetical protein